MQLGSAMGGPAAAGVGSIVRTADTREVLDRPANKTDRPWRCGDSGAIARAHEGVTEWPAI